MELIDKLYILADAAKYDASCASSGTQRRDSLDGRGIGSTGGMGICHSYAPDGRCISLLKILLTNFCQYECHYCVNRNSSNVQRARFTIAEVVNLTLDFYRRNYIEGLFLSSGIIRSPNYTMEQLVRVAKSLRETHDFRGYIHLKTIPDADGDLLDQAGQYADRLSINIELPTSQALSSLAPDKDHVSIRRSMANIHDRHQATRMPRTSSVTVAAVSRRPANTRRRPVSVPSFAPAGQSTQMIIGADATNDTRVLREATDLYRTYRLKRVYYSAFSPIPDAPAVLPSVPAPLVREHRLYQADWLMRFYDFSYEDIQAATDSAGNLPLDVDPKMSWALKHRDAFPVDVNRAARETLLRGPGLGTTSVRRVLQLRRCQKIRLADLVAMRANVKSAMPFIICADYHPGTREPSGQRLRQASVVQPQQAELSF